MNRKKNTSTKNKTVLVTGGAGYIGSHIVSDLRKSNYKVVVFDNLKTGFKESVVGSEFFLGDIRNRKDIKKVFKKHDIHAVFHLAALANPRESMKNPQEYFEVNVAGTLKLLKAIVEYKIPHLVYSSSCGVYGQPKKLPVTENASIQPQSVYGETKYLAEKMVTEHGKTHDINTISLRYFNVAGAHPSKDLGEAGQEAFRIVPKACFTALGKQRDFVLNGDNFPTPDGTCIRDYVHVMDVVNLHMLILKKYSSGKKLSAIFNVGSGLGVSNMEVVSMVKKVSGVKFPVAISSREKGDPAEVVSDISKIRKELGWKPKNSKMGNIIRSAWAWHSKHPSGYNS